MLAEAGNPTREWGRLSNGAFACSRQLSWWLHVMTSNPTEHGYLLTLRREVEQEINNYVYEVPDDAIGNRMTETAVADALAQMRGSLIDPYWVDVELRDTFTQIVTSGPAHRKCAAVADDGKGMVLLFDPIEKSFVLAQRGATGLLTFGVRGDAVGCFLSR